jgi:hypothetical protein
LMPWRTLWKILAAHASPLLRRSDEKAAPANRSGQVRA